MAQQVQVVLVDDLDGGKAAETVSFALDGVSYEIDLSAKNAAKLRELCRPGSGTPGGPADGARQAAGPARAGTARAT